MIQNPDRLQKMLYQTILIAAAASMGAIYQTKKIEAGSSGWSRSFLQANKIVVHDRPLGEKFELFALQDCCCNYFEKFHRWGALCHYWQPLQTHRPSAIRDNQADLEK